MEYLFLIHGFTGSSNDWHAETVSGQSICSQLDERFNKISIDLIGHGKSDSPNDTQFYNSDSVAQQIHDVISSFTQKKVVVAGYSLGGRAALAFAVKFHEKLKGLILESASAGLKKQNEKKLRIESDEKLAEFILQNDTSTFLTKWMDQELFGTLKRFSNSRIEELKKSRLHNKPQALANSLRGFGLGVMPYFGDHLGELNFPVLLLSGQLDSKFTKLNVQMQKQFKNAKHSVIQNSGHNIHLEETKKYINAVNKFLKKI
ncbi:MAG TPA: 2-succinyl-6-hydroxy-2,4-cyclohexadiene-1-carboxylate synthase [Ignavibacteriaceae bacterium]